MKKIIKLLIGISTACFFEVWCPFLAWRSQASNRVPRPFSFLNWLPLITCHKFCPTTNSNFISDPRGYCASLSDWKMPLWISLFIRGIDAIGMMLFEILCVTLDIVFSYLKWHYWFLYDTGNYHTVTILLVDFMLFGEIMVILLSNRNSSRIKPLVSCQT